MRPSPARRRPTRQVGPSAAHRAGSPRSMAPRLVRPRRPIDVDRRRRTSDAAGRGDRSDADAPPLAASAVARRFRPRRRRRREARPPSRRADRPSSEPPDVLRFGARERSTRVAPRLPSRAGACAPRCGAAAPRAHPNDVDVARRVALRRRVAPPHRTRDRLRPASVSGGKEAGKSRPLKTETPASRSDTGVVSAHREPTKLTSSSKPSSSPSSRSSSQPSWLPWPMFRS